MCTLGVGGRPLEVALGGEVARLEEDVRSRRRGGADGDDRPFSLHNISIFRAKRYRGIRKNPKVFAGSESEKKVRIRIRIQTLL
jgi:hypothetical protein